MMGFPHLPIPKLRYVIDEDGNLLIHEVVRNKGHKSEHISKFLIATVSFPIVMYPTDKLFEKYVEPIAEEIANSFFSIPLVNGDPRGAIDFIFASASMWWYHPLFRFDTLVRDRLCSIPQEMIRKGFYLLSDYMVAQDEDGSFTKDGPFSYTWESKAAFLFWLGRTGDGVVAHAAGFDKQRRWCESWRKRAKKDHKWFQEEILPEIEDWEAFEETATKFLDKSVPKSKDNRRKKEKGSQGKKKASRKKYERQEIDLHEFCNYQTIKEW
jgi:hypothetical protein